MYVSTKQGGRKKKKYSTKYKCESVVALLLLQKNEMGGKKKRKKTGKIRKTRYFLESIPRMRMHTSYDSKSLTNSISRLRRPASSSVCIDVIEQSNTFLGKLVAISNLPDKFGLQNM